MTGLQKTWIFILFWNWSNQNLNFFFFCKTKKKTTQFMNSRFANFFDFFFTFCSAYLWVDRLYSNKQNHNDSCRDRETAEKSTGALRPHLQMIKWSFVVENSPSFHFFWGNSLFHTSFSLNFEANKLSIFLVEIKNIYLHNSLFPHTLEKKTRIKFPSIFIQQ